MNKHKIINSLSWKSVSVFFNKIVSLIIKLILTRYLLPEHFGLISLGGIVVGLVSAYTDFGIGAALIQKENKKLLSTHWDTAFWINLGISWLGFIIISFIFAPVSAKIYGYVELNKLCIFLSINMLWSPLVFIHDIKLNKNLSFKYLCIINITKNVVGGSVGILMAINGNGIWSIVGQSISSSIIPLVIYPFMVKWKPSFNISKRASIDLISFGSYDVLNRLISFINLRFNILLIGILFDPTTLGLYSLASSFTVQIVQLLNSVFKKVFFPFFSEIKNDIERIKKYYLKQIESTLLIIIPLSTFIILFSKEGINILFYDVWKGLDKILFFLSLYIIIIAFGGTPGTIFKSLGHVKLQFKLSIIRYVAIRLPIVLLLGILYGIRGYLMGLIISQFTIIILDYYFVQRMINIKFIEVLGTIKNNIISIFVLYVTYIFFQFIIRENNIIYYFIKITLCAIIYIICIIFSYKKNRVN